MANQRAPLSEETLRHTREGLLQRITDQKRAGGVPNEPGLEADPLGGQRAAEEYLDPILRRVEVNHERDRLKDMVRVDEDELKPARFADTKEDVGTYDWNLRTDDVTPHAGSYVPTRDTSARGMVAEFIASLRHHKAPEWYSLLAIRDMCKAHVLKPSWDCVFCERREAAERRLIAMAIQKYRKKQPLRIT